VTFSVTNKGLIVTKSTSLRITYQIEKSGLSIQQPFLIHIRAKGLPFYCRSRWKLIERSGDFRFSNPSLPTTPEPKDSCPLSTSYNNLSE